MATRNHTRWFRLFRYPLQALLSVLISVPLGLLALTDITYGRFRRKVIKMRLRDGEVDNLEQARKDFLSYGGLESEWDALTD